MKTGVMAAIFAAAFFLQETAVPAFAFGPFGPDLLLCGTVLAVVMYENTGAAIVTAVFTAVAQGICFSSCPASEAASIFLVCLAVIFAGRVFSWESPVFLFSFTAAITLLHNLTLWAGQALMGAPYTFLYALRLQPGYMLCNTALMALLYFAFMKERKAGS